MSIHPQGEELRNAIKWISEERQNPKAAALKKLLEQACVKFDLSPMDAEFLGRYFLKKK
jgi:hypothetical protein